MTCFAEREFDYAALRAYEKALLTEYSFIRKEVIGYSLLHRELCAYTIGEDNGVLITAVFHGMERVTGAVLMRYLFEKARKHKEGREYSFTAIPLMNPDGAEIALYGASSAGRYRSLVQRLSKGDTYRWQANARGVDLNHNFNAGRVRLRENEIKNGFILRGPTRYGGTDPESEPEVAALCDFCRRRDFFAAAALHSQGREIYADFEDSAPESAALAEKMAARSGYTYTKPTGTAVGGGFKDWFSKRFCRPGFTIEIGKGENPLPIEVADTEYERVKATLDILTEKASLSKGG
ncbi:MAG: gamma-D-glutamyl-meso-diaminopimelate peptidase [Ruminococcus sp.]|nr:gamma-D-glutamyl-meso-diaminopimelate peptidase [Ruminococcus sp.]